MPSSASGSPQGTGDMLRAIAPQLGPELGHYHVFVTSPNLHHKHIDPCVWSRAPGRLCSGIISDFVCRYQSKTNSILPPPAPSPPPFPSHNERGAPPGKCGQEVRMVFAFAL
eukprot:2768558-Pleurochrysis_carterae.AAC.1